jgi:hypothetical protein
MDKVQAKGNKSSEEVKETVVGNKRYSFLVYPQFKEN